MNVLVLVDLVSCVGVVEELAPGLVKTVLSLKLCCPCN